VLYLLTLSQLQKVNLSLDDVICFDDILQLPLITEAFIFQKNLRLTLCDHNALAANLESRYGSSVVEILDHHADRGFYPWVGGEEGGRHIAFCEGKPTAMSTCTLVAEAFFAAQDTTAAAPPSSSSSPPSCSCLGEEVATLLLAGIALDSSNMTTATARDSEAVQV
jgi:inorganic pyrophosphatase/exopolyphosphatase